MPPSFYNVFRTLNPTFSLPSRLTLQPRFGDPCFFFTMLLRFAGQQYGGVATSTFVTPVVLGSFILRAANPRGGL